MNAHLTDGRVILTSTDGRQHDITTNDVLAAEAGRVHAEQETKQAEARAAWKARFGH